MTLEVDRRCTTLYRYSSGTQDYELSYTSEERGGYLLGHT